MVVEAALGEGNGGGGEVTGEEAEDGQKKQGEVSAGWLWLHGTLLRVVVFVAALDGRRTSCFLVLLSFILFCVGVLFGAMCGAGAGVSRGEEYQQQQQCGRWGYHHTPELLADKHRRVSGAAPT